jgi:hypothetical protein
MGRVWWKEASWLRRKWKLRGHGRPQTMMLTVVNPEQRGPADHPIRLIKELTEVALKELSPRWSSCTLKWAGPRLRRNGC